MFVGPSFHCDTVVDGFTPHCVLIWNRPFLFWFVKGASPLIEFAIAPKLNAFFVEISRVNAKLFFLFLICITERLFAFNLFNIIYFESFIPFHYVLSIVNNLYKFIHFEFSIENSLCMKEWLVLFKIWASFFQVENYFIFNFRLFVPIFILGNIIVGVDFFYEIYNPVFAKFYTCELFKLRFGSSKFRNFLIRIFRSIPFELVHIITLSSCKIILNRRCIFNCI